MSLSPETLLATTIQVVATTLEIAGADVDPDRSFQELGGSSLRVLQVRAEVSDRTGYALDIQSLLTVSIRSACDATESLR